MSMWEYIANSAMWSIGGWLIGYFIGRAERDIRFIRRKVEDDDDSSGSVS